MLSVAESGSTTLAEYQYDSLSRRELLTLGGVSNHKVDYEYSTNDRLTDLNHHLGSPTAAITFDYGYNDSGQLTSLAANDTFYLGKPRASETYTVNNLNQYETVGSDTLNYDQNGNLTRWDSPEHGVQRYTYDIENRLQTVAVNGSTSVSIFYDYDGLGRRVYKRTGATEGAGGILIGGTQTFYLLDGDEEIAEYDQNGNVLRRYITGPAIDDRIAMIEGSSTSPSISDRHFYHTNHQGSVVTTATQTGTVIDEYAYDEYGKLTDDSRATTEGQPFRYTGRRYDEETGLYYYRARYYSPELGRFLQTDPVGYEDQMNLYAYVANDPLNYTDPTGERKWGVNFVANVAAGYVGGKVRFDVNYDTTHNELNITATGGYKAGAQLGAKLEAYTEPSNAKPTGNRAAIEGTLKAEAVAEVNTPVGNASANAEASASGELSTDKGIDGDLNAGTNAGGSWGPVSIDSNGRASIGVGGNVGAAVSAQATGKVTVSPHDCTDSGSC